MSDQWDEKARKADALGQAECLRRQGCSCLDAKHCEARVKYYAAALRAAVEAERKGHRPRGGVTKRRGALSITIDEQIRAVERAAYGRASADVRAQTKALIAAAATLCEERARRMSAEHMLQRLLAAEAARAANPPSYFPGTVGHTAARNSTPATFTESLAGSMQSDDAATLSEHDLWLKSVL